MALFNPVLDTSPEGWGNDKLKNEGLGVLMQLPVRLGKKDVDKLFEHLKKILDITKRTS